MSTWNGKTLGKVQIGDLIARGGMAEVYYGLHTTLNRKVAVKIMRDHVEEDPESRARFEREAQVVAQLSHPNIIQIFDYDLVDGRPSLTMELIPGATLGTYLKALHKRGEKLPIPTIIQLMTAIAAAVDYAHAQNIAHRDIKPANILLRSKNGSIDVEQALPEDVEPVLTDFGLVRLLDSSTQTSTGTVSGTPAYMSPEQARGDKVDRKTDIYSLGVVLYEMLASTVPFDAESSFGILMKHLNDPPPPIPGISNDMQAIIDRALAKNPEHRFDSAQALVKEFIAVFNGQTVSEDTEKLRKVLNPAYVAKPVVEPIPTNQQPTYLRTALIAGAAVLVLLVGWFGFSSLRQPAKPANGNIPPANQTMGYVSYDDFNDVMDRAILNITGLPQLQPGKHYEAWYLSQGGEVRRNLGTIQIQGESGQLSYSNPDALNLISQFDQIQISIEPDNDPAPDQVSEEIVASSVYPPLALVHIRHIVVSFGSAPDGIALIQGLWGTTDSIDTSVYELNNAFAAGDEATLRLKTEEIINQLVGSNNAELYKDWDGDGNIVDPASGYGLLLNGEPGSADEQGYIPLTISHVEFAANAADATEQIQQTSDAMLICINNLEGWSKQMLDLTLKLQSMPFDQSMEATIAEIQLLSSRMLYGEDSNKNGRIEAIVGEGGADGAYEQAYKMAEMPLLPGPQRIPPPHTTTP